MKLKRFVKNLMNAIDKVSSHLSFMAMMALIIGSVHFSAYGDLNYMITFSMGMVLGISILMIIMLSVINALIYLELDDDEDLEIEKLFVEACEPALQALPEARRAEFKQRLIDACEYYPPVDSLKEHFMRMLRRSPK